MAGFDAKLLSAAADTRASGSSSRFGFQSCGIGLESKYLNALLDNVAKKLRSSNARISTN